MSQIVTWWVRWTLPDSAGVNVDCCPERGVQWSPPDYAVLDSSRVKSPERGIQWTPPDYAVLDSSRVKSPERDSVDSTGLCPPESTGMGINSQV